PLPPWTTAPCPGAAAAPAPLAGLAAAALAVVSVGAAAAVVVVAGACAWTVCVVPLSFLPIRTPRRRKIPRRAIAPMAKAGDHWGWALTGAPAPFAVAAWPASRCW